MKKLLFGVLMLLIVLLPLQTPIIVWLSTTFGGLYLWNSWKEVAVVSASLVGVILLCRDRVLVSAMLRSTYNKIALSYIALSALYAIVQKFEQSAIIGLAFNVRFVLVFLIAQIVGHYMLKGYPKISKAVIFTGGVVALFALAQVFVLPKDALVHIGYDAPGIDTLGIPPAYHLTSPLNGELRAQSTLRGPNVLGAYLIIPFFLSLVMLMRTKQHRYALVMLGAALGVVLSHSRSALGALLIGLAVWVTVTDGVVKRSMKRWWYVGAGGALIMLLILPFVWRTGTFQSVVLHNNPEVATVQSNEGHVELTKQAAQDVVRDPLGDGLGTAGPTSVVDNKETARIAENYFLQIGQETGWLGMVMFIALQSSVLVALYRKRAQGDGMAVFVAMLAITITNLLLHTWTDEAVSTTAWAMAGLVLGKGLSDDGITSKKRTISTSK